MNKYYIVTEEDIERFNFSTIQHKSIIEILDTCSAIVYTEMNHKEMNEYLEQMPPKIPY